jgi:hypothetical protein
LPAVLHPHPAWFPTSSVPVLPPSLLPSGSFCPESLDPAPASPATLESLPSAIASCPAASEPPLGFEPVSASKPAVASEPVSKPAVASEPVFASRPTVASAVPASEVVPEGVPAITPTTEYVGTLTPSTVNVPPLKHWLVKVCVADIAVLVFVSATYAYTVWQPEAEEFVKVNVAVVAVALWLTSMAAGLPDEMM